MSTEDVSHATLGPRKTSVYGMVSTTDYLDDPTSTNPYSMRTPTVATSWATWLLDTATIYLTLHQLGDTFSHLACT